MVRGRENAREKEKEGGKERDYTRKKSKERRAGGR